MLNVAREISSPKSLLNALSAFQSNPTNQEDLIRALGFLQLQEIGKQITFDRQFIHILSALKGHPNQQAWVAQGYANIHSEKKNLLSILLELKDTQYNPVIRETMVNALEEITLKRVGQDIESSTQFIEVVSVFDGHTSQQEWLAKGYCDSISDPKDLLAALSALKDAHYDEAREAMVQAFGRYLPLSAIVRHIKGDRQCAEILEALDGYPEQQESVRSKYYPNYSDLALNAVLSDLREGRRVAAKEAMVNFLGEGQLKKFGSLIKNRATFVNILSLLDGHPKEQVLIAQGYAPTTITDSNGLLSVLSKLEQQKASLENLSVVIPRIFDDYLSSLEEDTDAASEASSASPPPEHIEEVVSGGNPTPLPLAVEPTIAEPLKEKDMGAASEAGSVSPPPEHIEEVVSGERLLAATSSLAGLPLQRDSSRSGAATQGRDEPIPLLQAKEKPPKKMKKWGFGVFLFGLACTVAAVLTLLVLPISIPLFLVGIGAIVGGTARQCKEVKNDKDWLEYNQAQIARVKGVGQTVFTTPTSNAALQQSLIDGRSPSCANPLSSDRLSVVPAPASSLERADSEALPLSQPPAPAAVSGRCVPGR